MHTFLSFILQIIKNCFPHNYKHVSVKQRYIFLRKLVKGKINKMEAFSSFYSFGQGEYFHHRMEDFEALFERFKKEEDKDKG